MEGKRQIPQVRTPEDREFEFLFSELEAHTRGQVAPDGQMSDESLIWSTFPFGQAAYRLGSRIELGSTGVFVPSPVLVDFSRDESAPIRLLRIEIVKGVPGCTELRLATRDGGRGLRTADLEAIDLANWIEDVLTECAWRRGPHGGWDNRVAGAPEARRAVQDALRVGRRKISPELLSEVAEIYRANIDGKPIEAVRDSLGVEYRTAARYVQLCRSDEFDLLPKTQRGKRRA